MTRSPGSELRPTTAWFWIVALVVVSLDLVTKEIVKASMPINGVPLDVLGEFFRLRHIRNSGGLFGLFPGNAAYFAAVSIIAVGVILWVLARSEDRSRFQQIALGLVLGGALGNFHDRIRYREVVDFLDVGFGTHRWPTFNVADSGVTIGVSLLVVWLYVMERRRSSEEPSEPASRVDEEVVDRSS